MTTLLYTHPASLTHLTPPGHPERVDRIKALDQVFASPYFSALDKRLAPRASEAHLLLAHSAEYVQSILSLSPEEGFEYLDSDTVLSLGTVEAALRAVGGAVAAVDGVFQGEGQNAFCAMRPPGHHAESMRGLGFCFFNQAAIAALYARQRYHAERVAVIDFDVHHGNGTQEIFWHNPDLFYGSTHQFPLFPGTGAQRETGAGNIFNAPLRAGDDGAHFREAMSQIILPALDSFSPDFIVISAGFDAHRDDPLGSLELVEEDFAWITLEIMALAQKHAEGRIVSVLEGGYDLKALSASAAVHVQALLHGNYGIDSDDDEEEFD